MAITDEQQYASEFNHHGTIDQPLQSSWPYKDQLEPKRKCLSRFLVRRNGRTIKETKKEKDLKLYDLDDEMYDVDEEYKETFFVDNKKGITIGTFDSIEPAKKLAKLCGGQVRHYQPTDRDRDEENRQQRIDKRLQR